MLDRFRAVAGAVSVAVLTLGMGSVGHSQQLPSPQNASWEYRADWTGGFSGWMSYPLAQDVGFDPSLYTERQEGRTVLFHTFEAHGETEAWFGFIRPLTFSGDVGSTIELQYRLKIAGEFGDLRLILTGADGRQYSTGLPSSEGSHVVKITGASLSLKLPAQIKAIIIKGRLRNPPKGSESQWVLERFVLHAARPPEVALALPHMDASVDGSLVSRQVVRLGEPLHIELNSFRTPARIALYDPSGMAVRNETSQSGQKSVDVSLGDHPNAGLWRAEITEGDAKTSFRFLALGATPAHGHLLLSEQRLHQLSQDAKYAWIRQAIHERARTLAAKINFSSAAGDNIAQLASGSGLQPAYPGQLDPYLALVEAYADTVAYNALDYKLSGDRTSLTAAQRALLAIAQWKTWTPPRFQTHGMSTYYEVGCVAQRVAFGYDLIADQFSSQQKAMIAQKLWNEAIQPVVQEYFLYNRNPIAASNWMANSVGGALTAAVAVAGDTPGWNLREAPALADLAFAFEETLRGLFPGDGSEAEPAGYENFAMQGVSWGMSALARLDIQPQGARTMLEGFWWPHYATVTPGTQLDTGDFDGHLKGLSGFAWGAEYGGISELRKFYEQGTHLDLSRGAPVDQNGHRLEDMHGPLDIVCCSKDAQSSATPPPSRVFPERGSAVLRSGWGPDATVISLRVGPWFNHEHHDEGSFQVAALGKTLVNEAGYASYYTDPRYDDYFTQAPGHNTLLIDGDPFSQSAINSRSWPGFQYPHFSTWLMGASFDYLDADLTSAYDGRLQSYQREFVFLKPDVLVIHDRVQSAQPHQFSWLLHAPGAAKVTSDGGHASIQLASAGSAVGASLLAAGPNATWKAAAMPVPTLQLKNLDGPRIQPGHELQLDSARSVSAEFLTGIRVGANQAERPQMEPVTEAAGAGLRTVGEEPAGVVFRTGPGALQCSSLKTDGSMLACQGAKGHLNWMAARASYVESADGHTVFHSTAPADATLENTSSGVDLSLNLSAATAIEVFLATKPEMVELDDKSIPSNYAGQKLVFTALPAGSHHVLIR